MTAPRVSVFIASYNGERFVEAAVRSVLDQTFRDLELVVVDDASGAPTRAILQRLAATDPRMRLVLAEHKGQIGTLNHALSLCRGHYIARLDHDDIALPGRIEKQAAYLDAHPDCVVVGCETTPIDADGHPLGAARALDRPRKLHYDPLAFPPRCPFVEGPTPMWRAEVLSRVGGFRAEFTTAEDRDLCWRMAAHGRIAILPEALVAYRHHGGNLSVTRRRTQLLSRVFEDLSAIAAHVQLDDADIRAGIDHDADPRPTLAAYRALIGHAYPVDDFWYYYLARQGAFELDGCANEAEFMRRLGARVASRPFDPKRWRVWLTARKSARRRGAASDPAAMR